MILSFYSLYIYCLHSRFSLALCIRSSLHVFSVTISSFIFLFFLRFNSSEPEILAALRISLFHLLFDFFSRTHFQSVYSEAFVWNSSHRSPFDLSSLRFSFPGILYRFLNTCKHNFSLLCFIFSLYVLFLSTLLFVSARLVIFHL